MQASAHMRGHALFREEEVEVDVHPTCAGFVHNKLRGCLPTVIVNSFPRRGCCLEPSYRTPLTHLISIACGDLEYVNIHELQTMDSPEKSQ